METQTKVSNSFKSIHIMRHSDTKIREVSVDKEANGKIILWLSFDDDFYCHNTIEDMKHLRDRIDKAIEIAQDFDLYFEELSKKE